MIRLLYCLVFFSLMGCAETPSPEAPSFSAQEIVDAAIAKQGGHLIVNSDLEFDFRDKHYKAKRNAGSFHYERLFKDTSDNTIRDIYTNTSFERFINDTLATVTEERASAYSNSINSVIYFALLPYFLNAPAVNKSYLGVVDLKGQAYHKIKVSFEQEGGGKDFEDQYVYWFHKEKLTMDYLAYNYKVDGGGARFRQAYNWRTVAGVQFADFINYKPKNGSLEVEQFDQLFEQDALKELSRIDLENIVLKKL